MYSIKIEIYGIVQGVGFRPFVYNLAKKYNLNGFVLNTSKNVEIEVSGDKNNIEKFLEALNNPPKLAKIDKIITKNINKTFTDFSIKVSKKSKKEAIIPPDIAICNQCKKELKENSYFALTCVDCGPRYTIISSMPYDRDNTSMKKFKLCNICKKNYLDPNNRRFYEQGICCRDCGPKLSLIIKDKIIQKDIYKEVVKLIKDNKIGAIKSTGGFLLVCNTNEDTIKKLREYKRRPTKPFAIMCKDIKEVLKIAKLNKIEEKILSSKEAPIVLLDKKYDLKLVAPDINKIGVMLPYNGFFSILFNYLDKIIATSANITKNPIIKDIKEIKKLDFIDFIVNYDREIINRVDDSLVQVIDNKLQILRLSRGYAPKVIKLPFKIKNKILALGANQKTTISLAFDDKLILSPYIIDLETIESIEYYKEVIEKFCKIYDFKPDIIVIDKHTGYLNRDIAYSFNKKVIEVYHHIAHLYSALIEHNINNSIAFVFDGTGYGEDGTLWGGEVFINNIRKYYFKPIKLLGGEKAIKECKRVALSLLFEKYSLDEVLKLDIPTIKAFSKNEIKLLYNMWQKNLNSPLSSSVGRLFDAVSSLAGICQVQTYEGEAGIKSEAKYKDIDSSFKYNIIDNKISIEFDFFDKDLVSKFYLTLVDIIVDLSKKERLPVVFSGGVFQNKTLLELIIKRFKKENIKYYFNQTIPINDSGISVGQIYYVLKNYKG